MPGDSNTVSQVMSKTVYTIDSESGISGAAKLMARRDVGSLVVTAKGKPVGIVTERDIVKQLSRGGDALRKNLGALASKPLVTVTPTTEIWEAFATMLRRKIRRLPVMEGGNMVGIVTERDLHKWVVRVFYEPNVPADIRELVAQNP